jgi:hypothetical protein
MCVWDIPRPRPRTRARHGAIRRWHRCPSSTRLRSAHASQIMVYFWVWMSPRASVSRGGDGDGEFERVRCGCAYILPASSLARSLSLSFSSNSGGPLFSARFDVHPTSHPPSTYARPSRSTRQVAKFGYDMSLFYQVLLILRSIIEAN